MKPRKLSQLNRTPNGVPFDDLKLCKRYSVQIYGKIVYGEFWGLYCPKRGHQFCVLIFDEQLRKIQVIPRTTIVRIKKLKDR